MIWCNGDLVTNTNEATDNDLGSDPNFRENVRRQFLAKGAEGTPDPKETYIPMVDLDPSEGRAVRWFGAVVGGLLFLFGGFWFMSILGYTVPWYTLFPVLLMFVGTYFLAAAYATGRIPHRR